MQREGRFEIGFDHVFRRRKNVRDKIVSKLDPVIYRPADLELGKRVVACNDHGNKTGDA